MRTLIVFVFAVSAFGQSEDTPVYLEGFANLNRSIDRMYTEVTTSLPKTFDDRIGLQRRIMAMQKTTHQLSQSAAEANLDFMKRRRDPTPDKKLVLIVKSCAIIQALLETLDGYAETKDNIFVVVASELRQTIANIRKALP
jgi:hypothetical protein